MYCTSQPKSVKLWRKGPINGPGYSMFDGGTSPISICCQAAHIRMLCWPWHQVSTYFPRRGCALVHWENTEDVRNWSIDETNCTPNQGNFEYVHVFTLIFDELGGFGTQLNLRLLSPDSWTTLNLADLASTTSSWMSLCLQRPPAVAQRRDAEWTWHTAGSAPPIRGEGSRERGQGELSDPN